MKRTTRERVRKAESDFQLAVTIARGTHPFPDEQCFHCQQAAEKYLKAILEELGVTIPKTHLLVALLALLVPHHVVLRSLRRGVDFLTRFAVDARYPGYRANKRQAAAAPCHEYTVQRIGSHCHHPHGNPEAEIRQYLVSLPFHHKDPFDRMLAAQCLVGQIPLVSGDGVFDPYGIQRLW